MATKASAEVAIGTTILEVRTSKEGLETIRNIKQCFAATLNTPDLALSETDARLPTVRLSSGGSLMYRILLNFLAYA